MVETLFQILIDHFDELDEPIEDNEWDFEDRTTRILVRGTSDTHRISWITLADIVRGFKSIDDEYQVPSVEYSVRERGDLEIGQAIVQYPWHSDVA